MRGIADRLRWSLLFALMQLLGNAFLEGNLFLNQDMSLVLYFSILFVLIFSLTLMMLFLADLQSSEKKALVFRIVGYPVVGSGACLILYFLFKSDESNLSVYAMSFVLLALPGSIWSLLLSLFEGVDERISQMVHARVNSTHSAEPTEIEAVFHLENENGKLLLEIPVSRIICYEANDNYVLTHYLEDDGTLKRSMERISLRKIEQILADCQIYFLRVHKSYLVNPTHVKDLKGRSQAYKIQLHNFEQLIPVSRSFDVSLLGKRGKM
jgi:hypothetical protein